MHRYLFYLDLNMFVNEVNFQAYYKNLNLLCNAIDRAFSHTG